MAYFGFHGRYKKHTYEDCKDFKDLSFIDILNLDPSKIPSNILKNSCILKNINKPNYITSIQLDAIQHLLMIKNNARTINTPNYKEEKDRIIGMFKKKYFNFCQELYIFDTTNKGIISSKHLFSNRPHIPFASVKKENPEIEEVILEATNKIVDETMALNDTNERIKELEKRLKKLNSKSSKGGKKITKRKTKRKNSKKCFSLF